MGEAVTFFLSFDFGAQDSGTGGSKLATKLRSSNPSAQWFRYSELLSSVTPCIHGENGKMDRHAEASAHCRGRVTLLSKDALGLSAVLPDSRFGNRVWNRGKEDSGICI